MKRLIVFLATIFSLAGLHAQNGGFELIAPGSVSPIILDDVRKVDERALTKDTVLPPPQFTYTLQTKRYMTEVKLDTIKAAKLGTEPVQKLYRTYARFGVGNYSTVLGEFSVGSLRSKTGAYGIHVRHFSAGSGPKDVAGDFSGFNQQDVNLFGKRFLKRHVLYGTFDYDRDAVFNYGSVSQYSSFDKKSTRQYYNYFSPAVRLQSQYTDSSAINHDIGLRYYHLADRYEVKEDNILIDARLSRFIRTERITLDLGVDYNYNSGADTVNNTILKFQPMISAHNKKIEVLAGLGIYMNPDDALWYFYPQFSFSYDIVNHILVPYVTLGGRLERNSFRTLSQENPFMLSTESFALRNTQHKGYLELGLRGDLGAGIVYDIRASRVDLIDAPFFVNTTSVQDLFQNKFAVVYDTVTVANIHGQVGWQQFERIRITATGDWYQYNMTHEARPWHTPTLRMSLLAEYNLRDKILTRGEIYYFNGQYAKVNGAAVTLKGLVDVNLGMEYRYTKFLSVFLNVNNLAAQRYNRWYAYPTQKINVMAGLTYTF